MRSTDFADFYQREAHALVRFAATIVGPSRADDVVANAVLSVMNRVMDNPSSDVPQSDQELRPYLYRAVANAGAKEWRSLGRRARRLSLVVSQHGLPNDRSPGPDQQFEGSSHSEITTALAQLSPRQRAVVHLAYWEDLTSATIAERLGISEGSVKRHLARARAALRTSLTAEASEATEASIQTNTPGRDTGPLFGGRP